MARCYVNFLLLEVALPPIPRRPWGTMVILASSSFLLGVFSVLFFLSPQAALDPSAHSAPDGVPDGGDAGRAEAAALLQKDFAGHAGEHWRMLLPQKAEDFDVFVASVAGALRARPLGQTCLAYAMNELAPKLDLDSLWLEFGVWRGGSLSFISKTSKRLGRRRKVYGFDSFRGLPETWRTSTGILGDSWAKRWVAKGAFDLGGEAPELFVDTSAAAFVVGWFNESIPPFMAEETGPVSFVHVDSDLYSSAITALSAVTPRLVSGAVIVFDELINYPGFRDGEIRALYEWLHSPEFRDSSLTGIQVVGYRGPNLVEGDAALAAHIREQRGEGRKWPQDAIFRVW